jgi:lysophospholipase L1-like esterase
MNSSVFLRGVLFFILFVSVIGCSDKQKMLLFLGDLQTAGDGIDAQRTFPALVERQLYGFRSINLGRSGWSTEAYLQRWDEIEDDFPSSADVVFIQLGINDLKIDGHNDKTITTCINNMQKILSRLRNHFPNAEIVLMSSTKIDFSVMNQQSKEAGFSEETNTYLSKIAEGYSVIALDFGYSFIDLHRLIPIRNTWDGVHLNENGNEIAAKTIIQFLRKLYVPEEPMDYLEEN